MEQGSWVAKKAVSAGSGRLVPEKGPDSRHFPVKGGVGAPFVRGRDHAGEVADPQHGGENVVPPGHRPFGEEQDVPLYYVEEPRHHAPVVQAVTPLQRYQKGHGKGNAQRGVMGQSESRFQRRPRRAGHHAPRRSSSSCCCFYRFPFPRRPSGAPPDSLPASWGRISGPT